MADTYTTWNNIPTSTTVNSSDTILLNGTKRVTQSDLINKASPSGVSLTTIADDDALNNSIYDSSDQSALTYKDASGNAAPISDAVSVKQYGATGDGSTDDAAAINAAIAANPGKVILFPQPATNYKIAAKIVNDASSPCILMGEVPGIPVVWRGAADGADYAVHSKGPVHNLYIQIQTGTARRGLHLEDVRYKTALKDIIVYQASNVAIYIEDCWASTFEHVAITYLVSGIGIDAYRANRCSFYRLSANACTPSAAGGVLQFRTTDHALVFGLNIELVNASASLVNLDLSYGIQFKSIVLESCTCNNNAVITLTGAPQHDQATIEVDGIRTSTNDGCTELVSDNTSTRSFVRLKNVYSTTTAMTSLVEIDGTNLAGHRAPEFEACFCDRNGVQLSPNAYVSLINGATVSVASVTRLPTLLTASMNVREFGVVGDGVTDDTSNINIALAAASGQQLFFDNGTYLVSGVLSPLDHTYITGPFAYIQQAKSNSPTFSITKSHVTFDNINIVGKGTETPWKTAAFPIDDVASTSGSLELTSVSGVFTAGHAGFDLQIVSGTNFIPGFYNVASFVSVSSVMLSTDPTNGYDAVSGVVTDGIFSSYNGVGGIYITNTDNITIKNCNLTNHAGGSIVYRNGCDNLTIVNNTIRGMGSGIIGAGWNGADGSISHGGTLFDNNGLLISENDISDHCFGIFFATGSDQLITNNKIHDIPGQHGFYGAQRGDTIISNNIITDIARAGGKVQTQLAEETSGTLMLTNNVLTRIGDFAIGVNPAAAAAESSTGAGDGYYTENVVISNNQIYDTVNDGIFVRNIKNLTVENNQCNRIGRYGVYGTYIKGCIANNTFRECDGTAALIYNPEHEVTYYNNNIIDTPLNVSDNTAYTHRHPLMFYGARSGDIYFGDNQVRWEDKTANVVGGATPLACIYNDTNVKMHLTGPLLNDSNLVDGMVNLDLGSYALVPSGTDAQARNNSFYYSSDQSALTYKNNSGTTLPIYDTVATAYCGPAGNDSTGDGTRSNPYLTLRGALNAVGAGSKIIALDGDYTYLYLTSADNGTSDKLTKIMAENKWGASISGDATHHAVAIQAGTEYIDVSNFEVLGQLDGVKVEGPYCSVHNNWIHDTGTQGIMSIGTAASGTYKNNLIENCGTTTGHHGVYNEANNIKCHNNLIRNSSGYGLHFYSIDPGLSNCDLYRNYTDKNGTGGIIIYGPSGVLDFAANTNCGHTVRNNYVVMDYDSAFSPLYIARASGCIVKDNILINGAGPDIYEWYDCPDTTYTNNIKYPQITDQNTHGAYDVSELLTDGGLENVTGGGFDSWVEYVSGSTTITADTTEQDSGSYCCRFNMDGSSTYCHILQSGVMTIGDVYTLTLRATTFEPGSRSISMLNPTKSFSFQTSISGVYTTFSQTFVSESEDLTIRSGTNHNGSFFIDNISLMRAYGPNAGDIARNTPVV